MLHVLVAPLLVSLFTNGALSDPGAGEPLPLKPIFDGKTLDGWVNYKTGKAPDNWGVEDGALVRLGGGGDIMTAAQYDNFELHLEWKIAAKGNSGIMYRVRSGDGAPYFSGPEYQVFDDAGHGLDAGSNVSAGALYGLVSPEGKSLKPTGEYNSARIVLQGDHLEHWLNGKKVLEIELDGEKWKGLVQGSKFKKWSQFGASPIGHIDLQEHGSKVWYRNIRLRPLPPPKPTGMVHADLSPASSHALLHQFAGSGELVVLDVRTQEEYDRGHLARVEHIDFYHKDFKHRLGGLDRDKTYLVYCKVGGRSGKAVGMMKELGFRVAYNMAGGWDRWSAEKRPTAKAVR